jgi:hypothetical protein
MQTDHREQRYARSARMLSLAIAKPDRRESVTPTKILLVVLLLASAIGGAFANPPVGSYNSM